MAESLSGVRVLFPPPLLSPLTLFFFWTFFLESSIELSALFGVRAWLGLAWMIDWRVCISVGVGVWGVKLGGKIGGKGERGWGEEGKGRRGGG